MKKITWFLGILFLIIIIILNLIYSSFLDSSDHTTISYNSFFYILGVVFIVALIYYISLKLNNFLLKKDTKFKKRLFKILLIIYAIFNVVWIIFINPKVVCDSVHVCNLAQTFSRNNAQEFLYNGTYAGVPLIEYMQAYTHQIPLAFIYSIFFRIIHFDIMEVLRIINIISNIAIVIGLYKINSILSEKYKTSTPLMFILILTFFTLPILSTFIYGDIPSLALCIFAIYYMMCFNKTHNIKYFIFSAVLTMLAYMMRMNSLIFIIATIIYMFLCLLQSWKQTTAKNRLKGFGLIIVYVIVSIIPSTLVINYYSNKYNLDTSKTFPSISYILMSMEESPRANGWYNENIAVPALKDPDMAKREYPNAIKERLKYFAENPGYTFNFYREKVASMWTENTYSAIRSNIRSEDDFLENFIAPLAFYQKALLILTSLCSMVVLIQNRQNLSLEVIFLLLIFVGGFSFHILWEAKARYIIPYIVVLIPIASICINKVSLKNIEK